MTWHVQNVGPAMKVKRILRLTRLMPIRCPPSRACEHAYPCSRQGIAPQCPQGVPEARHRHAREGAQTSLHLLGGLRVDGPSQVSRSRMQAGAAGQRVCRRHLATDAAGGSRLCRRGAERGDPSPRPARDPEYGAWSRHRFERPHAAQGGQPPAAVASTSSKPISRRREQLKTAGNLPRYRRAAPEALRDRSAQFR